MIGVTKSLSPCSYKRKTSRSPVASVISIEKVMFVPVSTSPGVVSFKNTGESSSVVYFRTTMSPPPSLVSS